MATPVTTANAAGVSAGSAPEAVAVFGARPYAWPYDGVLIPAQFALAVVTGRPDGGDAAADSLTGLAAAIRARGAAVIWIGCSGGRSPHAGADPADLVVDAPTANGFLGSDLDLVLRTGGIDKLAFAGAPTEIAVHSTLRRANDLGYECIVLEDVCTPADPALQESSISQILMSGGIFGAVGSSSALIEALDAVTRAPARADAGTTDNPGGDGQ